MVWGERKDWGGVCVVFAGEKSLRSSSFSSTFVRSVFLYSLLFLFLFLSRPPSAFQPAMNVLTQVANTRKLSQLEAARGIEGDASWHARYSHSAYIFAGGFPQSLTEGDLLAVFAQYGEVVDVHLVR